MNRQKFIASLVLSALLCSIAFTETGLGETVSKKESAPSSSPRAYPDNAFKDIPHEYFTPCENGGTITKFTYKTRDNQTVGSAEFEKSALVYLPYGYDENDSSVKYDVLYLMHGGGDSPAWHFGGSGINTPLKNVLDHMIKNGDMKPLIICAVSYYTPYSPDATKNCIDFYYELNQDIIPVFELRYHTFASNASEEELNKTRGHRAFGGFSMGACATWSAFEHCIDEMKYFLPVSGDCWAIGRGRFAETAKHLSDVTKKNGKTALDFKIYSGCGRFDIAQPNLTPMINEMKKYPDVFIYCDNFAAGNLYQCIYEKGGHDINTVMRVMYNGLPKMFD